MSRIIGTGSYLPCFEMDNKLLCEYFPGKGSEWIEQKTGIKKRRFGFDFENNKMRDGFFDNDIAELAAKLAIDMAGISPSELDLIIRITCTQEHLYFPDPACVLNKRLKASRDCVSYTISTGCGGLIYALKTVDDQIRSGGIRIALIVASNTPSSFANVKDHKLVKRDWLNSVFFGDGASAIVLANDDTEKRGILASYCGACHEHDPIKYPAGGSRFPTTIDNVYEHWYQMDVKAISSFFSVHFKYAIKKLMAIHPFSSTKPSYNRKTL